MANIGEHHRMADPEAVRRAIERTTADNRSAELFPEPPLRRGRAGLGYVPPVLEGRHLHDKATWDKTGHPAKYIQIFSWNAGNLQRTSNMDTLNDLLASQFHVACLQEAEVYSGQQFLFESRGLRSAGSHDRSILINAGGTGLNVVKK